ncbi:MAG: YeeE/YedE family protein [Pseudorhodoplanes sp.]|nr:YeeE/YedE family protein [Pseudorhodoplanes sp.]
MIAWHLQMNELAPSTIAGIGGFLTGFAFGAVAQRTNFCAMGAISDLVLMGDGRRFRAWVLAIAVAIIGTQALHFAGVLDVDKSIYLSGTLGWLGAIIGGLMFGFGMTQAGGCAGKTLIRLGGGNLKSLIVTTVLGIVAYTTLRGLIALFRVQLEDATNIDLKARGLQSQNIGELAGMAVGLNSGTARIAVAAIVAFALLLYCFRDTDFRRSPINIIAGILIGACSVAGWLVTGVLAADDFNPVPLASVTFVSPIAESLQYLMTFTGSTVNFGIGTVGGVIAGSFLVASLTGAFHIESFADRNDLVRHLYGAALMGAGGVLALGCTIGQGITGMSTLSLGSLIAWLSILGGGYLGIKYLEEGSFGDAIRAVFARG